MEKHTLGPWTKADRLNGPWWHIAGPQTASGRQAVACVHGESKRGSKYYSEMFEANARLIAAAPDLLAALEKALEQLIPSSDEYAEATAAIAKATGTA